MFYDSLALAVLVLPTILGIVGLFITSQLKPVQKNGMVLCGLAITVLTGWSQAHDRDQHGRELSVQALNLDRIQDKLTTAEVDGSYMRGKLDTITSFISQYVSRPPSQETIKFDPAFAAALLKMLQPKSAAQSIQPQGPLLSAPIPQEPHPLILSVPASSTDTVITGRNLRSTPGWLFVHPRLREYARTGVYEYNWDNLLGGLRASNYVAINSDVKTWSDSRVELKSPAGDRWRGLLENIKTVAEGRRMPVPAEADVEFCYQIETLQEAKTNCVAPSP